MVTKQAESLVPTEFGNFRIIAFSEMPSYCSAAALARATPDCGLMRSNHVPQHRYTLPPCNQPPEHRAFPPPVPRS